jgi:hypothetical protein
MAEMNDYLVTVWHDGEKYCYVMGCTDPEKVREEYKETYDRFTMVLLGD